MLNLDELVDSTLNRLGDLENVVWSREELELYLKDGYAQFTRQTRCLFDIHVIENLPRYGNWQNELQKFIVSQQPGATISDEPLFATSDTSGALGVDGKVGGSYGPIGGVSLTKPTERQLSTTDDGSGAEISTVVPGGRVPEETVAVLRVTHNLLELKGASSAQMRQMDTHYETRTGTPQWFVYDKDGMFYLRVVPAMNGDAEYDTVYGTWGTLTYTDESDLTIISENNAGYGILKSRGDWFPANGILGSPTRIHPATNNVRVELYRMGRDLSNYPSELPLAYDKYVIYWAMGRALNRQGPGQDMELGQHYLSRFQMGVDRMVKKREKMSSERTGRFGSGATEADFGLGDPQPPYPYGVARY